ncbi:hypothetical protein IFT48_02735 [Pseudomonas fluorescens]|uniref:hypothetical protein n=1 Tax=Pseudomonas fluorescens TaxID=294 RepID=UPI001930AF98|nr:hypothetical protein [Pseudomonas fluorescens]MBD8088882.1 hypothetical protein [Pseudomonas fluorescens]
MSKDWITKLLVLAGVIYVIAEIIANANLLTVVGSHHVSHEAVEDMEKLMRVLSGCGAVILLSNLILPLFRKTRHRVQALVLIAGFMGPFTYLAVQLMVDGIVGNSTRAERDAGVMAYIYRMGMTNGGIEHSAALVADRYDSEGKALLGSMGLYVFPGSVLGEAITSKKPTYAKVIFTAEMNRDDLKGELSHALWRPFDDKYNDYLDRYQEKISIPSHELVLADVRRQQDKCIRYRARKDCNTPDFLNSDYVKKEVNKKIKKDSGLTVVEDYWLTDRESFRRAMLFSAIKAAKAKGQAKDVEYPMARQEFANSPDVSRWLSVIGFPYHFKGMGMSEYFWGYYADKPRAIAGLTQNLLAIDLDGYQAEQIYRSMIIPPVALFLSLFFATLNIISLLASWITIRLPGRWYKLGVKVSLVGLAAVGPLFMSNAISQSKWYEMITVGMSQISPLRYYVATWILQVEPFIGRLVN